MDAAIEASGQTQRIAGLDALRAATTLLVVFHHTALTYGAIGGWYYREVVPDGGVESGLLVLFCAVNQAWFMGLFFLLAGYFTPAMVERHGAWGFLRERLRRLGIPLLVYALAIGPCTIALAQTARGRSFFGTLERLWEQGVFENGPLWFAQALLIFAVCFVIWRSLSRSPPRSRPFPSNRMMAGALVLTGLAAFSLRLVWPVGTTWFGLQLGYFASYALLFAAGCAGARSGWLAAVPDRQLHLWVWVAWLALPILPLMVKLAPSVPLLQGRTEGGFSLQALVYAVWEPLVAWGFILGLVAAFTRRVQATGRLWRALIRRAYTIFILHPPVLVGVSLLWRDVPAPHLLKFAVTGTVACLVCFWTAGLLLRAPMLRRIV